MIFNSLLIANRGEIACRIIKTAKEMGIRSIAVYVDADKDALFVEQADESVRLEDGGYLDGNQIINAAKEAGAQAIHPGYGFLSENASFARKVKKEGIIWVGPSANVISVMGDKLKAKDLAIKADVPTLPMTSKPAEAKNIGYPLLIKAAAGGGGKGMKIVDEESQLENLFLTAKSEAKKVLSNAKDQSEKIVEDSKTKATEEKNRIVASAQAEIDKEVVNAKKSLEKDFATNVMSAAKKIVGKEISETNHGDTIQKSLDDFRK